MVVLAKLAKVGVQELKNLKNARGVTVFYVGVGSGACADMATRSLDAHFSLMADISAA